MPEDIVSSEFGDKERLPSKDQSSSERIRKFRARARAGDLRASVVLSAERMARCLRIFGFLDEEEAQFISPKDVTGSARIAEPALDAILNRIFDIADIVEEFRSNKHLDHRLTQSERDDLYEGKRDILEALDCAIENFLEKTASVPRSKFDLRKSPRRL